MSVSFRQRTPGELARMVWRRKWMIVLPALAVGVAVAWVVMRLPDVYESTTLLTVRPASISTSVVPQLSDSDLTIRINNISQQVMSRSTLEPMIERFGLYAGERRRGVPMDELVERMKTKDVKLTLNTSRNEVTNGFILSFRSPEKRVTQAVTEALASKYVAMQIDAAGSESKNTKEFFTDKVNQAKEQLDEIDKRRLSFMMSNIQSLPSGTQALIGQLAGLREAQTARINEIGRMNDQIAANNKLVADLSKMNQQGVEEFVALMQDPKGTAAYAELVKRKAQLESDKQALLKVYRDKHPDVIVVQSQLDSVQREMNEMVEEHKRKVEEQRKRLEAKVDPRLNSYKSDIARFEGEVKRQQALLNQTESQIAAIEQRINNVPGSEVGLEAINREYLSAKAVYDSMLQQKEKADIGADIAGRAQGESIAVIDAASFPEKPVAPKRPMLMLLGLFVGLGVGIVLAAAFEVPRLLTIQTTEDAEHYTGLPVLVTLPTLLTPREERNQKLRRVAFAVAGVAATILSAPALAFVLTRLHLIEMIASRG
jgi:polysaccharide chain length determinant protein (PEP-CTERM system associated)